jgi:diguanylate cyclase (GGDEF)-like protein
MRPAFVGTVRVMLVANGFSVEDMPDLPCVRQLQAGFPWLTFAPNLEAEFRRSHLDESIGHLRANLVLGLLIAIAFAAMDALVLGHRLNRVPGLINVLAIIPVLSAVLAASFSPRRHRIHAPLTIVALTLYGLCQIAIQIIAAKGGAGFLFPTMILTAMYVYFMAGLIFYHSIAVNVVILIVYLGAMTVLQRSGPELEFSALALVAANLIGASVVYMHEKTSRMRFLEAGLLREMVARDGLTGISNRRMFDQHIQRAWQQAVRARQRVAVLLVDIDCFKNYNDRYGHQAGDECLRAVAGTLSQCARRPLDFVARYGGEEFAVVLFEASREYVAEVLIGIQRSIAELNIPHEASIVASRLTVSIGAAYVLPSAGRTHEGLVQLADEALYNAKEQGRNRVLVMEAEYQSLKTGRFDKRRGVRVG